MKTKTSSVNEEWDAIHSAIYKDKNWLPVAEYFDRGGQLTDDASNGGYSAYHLIFDELAQIPGIMKPAGDADDREMYFHNCAMRARELDALPMGFDGVLQQAKAALRTSQKKLTKDPDAWKSEIALLADYAQAKITHTDPTPLRIIEHWDKIIKIAEIVRRAHLEQDGKLIHIEPEITPPFGRRIMRSLRNVGWTIFGVGKGPT